ncbi:MAG: Spy/CpxP family protein refolding chaperone [Gemmatimonadota bacterium]|nr:Spy/CpxP family protein refolding chaperone [Gemmatimonadota bacterium]
MSLRSSFIPRYRPLCRSHARTLGALIVALAFATSALTAQGGRRGGAPDQSAPARPTVAPVLWEPEQIFPLADSRASTLKLTDEQRTKLETIYSQMKAKNAPLLDAIDTLRPPRVQLPTPGEGSATAPTPPAPTAEEIAAIVARRHALGEARAQIRENIRLARDELTQLMTPEQQTKLAALESSARSDAERGDRGGTVPDHSLTGGQRSGRGRGQIGTPNY